MKAADIEAFVGQAEKATITVHTSDGRDNTFVRVLRTPRRTVYVVVRSAKGQQWQVSIQRIVWLGYEQSDGTFVRSNV